MKDYYALLEITYRANSSEIRKAYRKLAKNNHPDKAGVKGTNHFMAITEAYEVLISPSTRKSYDQTYQPAQPESKPWNYPDFLRKNLEEPQNIAKLICYDLLHDNAEEAMDLFEKAPLSGFHTLKSHLDREDYMDFGFLLAEAYLADHSYVKAFRILRGLADMEEDDPYFKHFYVEILERLASIIRRPFVDDFDDVLKLTFLTDLLRLQWPAKDEARLRKLHSELLNAHGKHNDAANELFKAYKLAPNLPGIKESVTSLKKMGLYP